MLLVLVSELLYCWNPVFFNYYYFKIYIYIFKYIFVSKKRYLIPMHVGKLKTRNCEKAVESMEYSSVRPITVSLYVSLFKGKCLSTSCIQEKLCCRLLSLSWVWPGFCGLKTFLKLFFHPFDIEQTLSSDI